MISGVEIKIFREGGRPDYYILTSHFLPAPGLNSKMCKETQRKREGRGLERQKMVKDHGLDRTIADKSEPLDNSQP